MTGNHGKFYSYKIYKISSVVIQLNFSSGILVLTK